MSLQGSSEDCQRFYDLIGRYVVAAGQAEDLLYRTLIQAQRLASQQPDQHASDWKPLVEKLGTVSSKTAFHEEVDVLLKGAVRRGLLRNNLVHAAWESAYPDGASGRRHFRKNKASESQGSVFLLIGIDELRESLRTMEWFRDELGSLASRMKDQVDGAAQPPSLVLELP